MLCLVPIASVSINTTQQDINFILNKPGIGETEQDFLTLFRVPENDQVFGLFKQALLISRSYRSRLDPGCWRGVV
jgi:hypothetical protein